MYFPPEFNTDAIIEKLHLSPIEDTEDDMRSAIDAFIDTVKKRYGDGQTDWMPGPEIIIECPGEFTQMCVSKYIQTLSKLISYHSVEPTNLTYLRQHRGQTLFKGSSIVEVRIKSWSRLFTENGVSEIIRDGARLGNNLWTPLITTIGDKNKYGLVKSWRFIRLRCEPATADDW